MPKRHKTSRRSARRRWAVLGVLAACAVAGAVIVVVAFWPAAAIVDQLSLSAPGPEFVETATATLERAGYEVDYFPGEQVTVDLYRDLPKRGYDLIVLRAHSGRIRTEDLGGLTDDVTLFTGEPFLLGQYDDELRSRALVLARYFEDEEKVEPLFGVTSEFVRSSMKGGFDGALVVMMGCDGLRSRSTAEAFLERGASAFVSWSDLVSATHTDAATERLLEKLVNDGLPVDEAVAQTKAELGPDPAYGAEMRVLTAERVRREP
jgi:hypothetical protein